jgi:phage gp36-like protein
MAYIDLNHLIGELPQEFLRQATDDIQSGEINPDVKAAIEAAVQEDIDGPLAARYSVPFTDPIPALIKRTARIFALEKLYNRRGITGDANPWTKQADKLRDTLELIAKRELDLQFSVHPAHPSVSVVTEKNKLNSTGGLNLT